MSSEFNDLSKQEKLKADNEFLKMKLMLERGAQFVTGNKEELPAGVENEFLRNIIEYEKQFDEHKTIKVFDKIGRPLHFKPVGEISDDGMETAWKELREYLSEYNIDLSVCSPNVSLRELYRFTTEELFKYEMDEIDIPGMMTGFIYDEFYPDPVYDNSQMVERGLLRDIFSKSDLFYEIHYDKTGFIFNDRSYKGRVHFFEVINRFKSLFTEIELNDCEVISSQVKDTYCEVIGNYRATAKSETGTFGYSGAYKVELVLRDAAYWYFNRISIDGFNPA